MAKIHTVKGEENDLFEVGVPLEGSPGFFQMCRQPRGSLTVWTAGETAPQSFEAKSKVSYTLRIETAVSDTFLPQSSVTNVGTV